MRLIVLTIGLSGLLLCTLGYVGGRVGSWENRQAAPLCWLPGLALLAFDALLAVGYATVRVLLT